MYETVYSAGICFKTIYCVTIILVIFYFQLTYIIFIRNDRNATNKQIKLGGRSTNQLFLFFSQADCTHYT